MLTALPKSPLVVPHPSAELSEALFQAELIGQTVLPTKESIEGNLTKLQLGAEYEDVRDLLLREFDNASMLREGVALPRFNSWMTHTSEAAICMKEDGNGDHQTVDDARHSLFYAIERMRHNLCNGALFESKALLDDSLDQTDIGADIPASYFRLPYPIMYFRFGEGSRGFQVLKTTQIDCGDVFLDGAYLREINHPDGRRDIVVTATMRCPSSDLPYSQPFNQMVIQIRDNSVTLDSVLDQLFWREGRSLTPDRVSDLKVVVFHIAKLLLYLCSEHAKTQKVTERTEALVRLKAAGQKKQIKRAHQAQRAYDRIVIGTEVTLFPVQHSGASGHSMTTHWRRGHFRQQAHGVGMALRKIAWIAPVLVNANQIGENQAATKPYLVTNGVNTNVQ